MKDNRVILKGVDDVLRLLNDYPNEINKIAKAALRKAITPLVKSIKSGSPVKGVKIKIKPLKGMNPSLKFGKSVILIVWRSLLGLKRIF